MTLFGRRDSTVSLALGALAVALVFAACGSDAGGDAAADGTVDGPLLAWSSGSGSGMDAIVLGVVELSPEGCLRLGGMPVVWPAGTRWNDDDGAIQLPNDVQVNIGDQVNGGGGYLDVQAISSLLGRDVADAVEPCLGKTGEIAVFNASDDVAVEPGGDAKG